jgi:hypothetical protein
MFFWQDPHQTHSGEAGQILTLVKQGQRRIFALLQPTSTAAPTSDSLAVSGLALARPIADRHGLYTINTWPALPKPKGVPTVPT